MNPRKEALHILSDVLDRGAYANLRLKALPPDMEARDKKWITALVYTALDHIIYADYLISHFVSKPCKPVIRNILRLGVTELLYFATPAHAVIDEYAALTRQIGKTQLVGFVNAVLRSVDRSLIQSALPPLPSEPAARLSVQYSFPKWLVDEWLKQYGEAFTEALLSAPPFQTTIRAQYPCTTDALLKEIGVPCTRGALEPNCLTPERLTDITALPAFIEGRMTAQGQSAMLACRALGDCRSKRVLDACAAPGGKTAYLASLCENNVRITAMELHEHRKSLLDKTLTRLHVPAETVLQDAAEPVDAFMDAFDAVIIDAPCSGLGVLADKPDIRYARSDADVDALAALQARILDACAHYVKKDGVLLYVTCTISRRENEENVRAFLDRHSTFSPEPIPFLPTNDGMLQLFPHVHHTDGFFFARMRRCF